MDAKNQEFLEMIARLAHELPPNVLHSITESIDALPANASPNERLSITSKIPHPSTRNAISELLHKWCVDCPDLSSQTLSWALRTAGEADSTLSSSQEIELVWSGPVLKESKLRRTEQVFLDLIRNATDSILIVSFVVYNIPTIAEALLEAAERGVKITLVLESPEESEGKTAVQIIKAIGSSLLNRSDVYIWPLDKRPKNTEGKHGSLHVKCAIADNSTVVSFLSCSVS